MVQYFFLAVSLFHVHKNVDNLLAKNWSNSFLTPFIFGFAVYKSLQGPEQLIVPDLENMLGMVCIVHPIQAFKNLWRVTKLVWDLALFWWNTILFLLNNSGLFCFSESFNLSSWWQYTSEWIVVLNDKSSKNKIPLKSHQTREHHLVLMNIGFRSDLSRIIFLVHDRLRFNIIVDNPFLVSSDNSLQKWVIYLTL